MESSPEEFTVTLTGTSRSDIDLGTTVQGTGQITSDDTGATVSIAAGPVVSTEGTDATATFALTLGGTSVQAGETVDVYYTLAGGSASLGSDFSDASATPGQVTLTAGSAAVITVNIDDDGVVEIAEDYTVTLTGTSRSDIDLGSTVQGTGQIDNDDTAEIEIEMADRVQNSLNEGDTARFTVSLDGDIADYASVDVSYHFNQGGAGSDTAVLGDDYTDVTPGPGAVTLTQAQKTFDIEVNIEDDNFVEPDQRFLLTLTGVTGLTGVDLDADPLQIQGQGTIVRNDSTEVSISGDATVTEGAAASYTVTLTNPIEGAGAGLTVDYQATDGSAVVASDLDFTVTSANPDSVTISEGDTTAGFSYTTYTDSYVEAAEDYKVVLTGAATGNSEVDSRISISTPEATTIIDNNDTAVVSLSGPVTVTEDPVTGNMLLNFTITLDSTHVMGAGQVTVDYATEELTGGNPASADVDYISVSDSKTFEGGGVVVPGSGDPFPTWDFQVQVKNDQIIEPDEQFRVYITPGTNATAGATTELIVTIVDNDYSVNTTATTDGTLTSYVDHVVDSGTDLTLNLDWLYGLQALNVNGTDDKGNATRFNLLSGGIGSPGPTASPGTATYTLTVTENTTVEAVYRHRIGYSIGDNGSVNVPGVGTVSGPTSASPPPIIVVDHFSTPTFDSIEGVSNPTSGIQYCVKEVVAGGVSQGSPPSYAFPPVEDSSDFNVTFRDNKLVVTIGPAVIIADMTDDSRRGQWKLLDQTGTPLSGWLESGDALGIQCNVTGYKIVFKDVPGWTTPNSADFTIDPSSTSNPTYHANYQATSYVVTILQDHELAGQDMTAYSYTLEPPGENAGDGNYIFQTGDVVQITGHPAGDDEVDSWQGVDSAGDGYAEITVNAERTVKIIYGRPSADNDLDGFDVDVDCNDNNRDIYPGAPEPCTATIDMNCDGMLIACTEGDEDQDGDGYTPNQGDCHDTNANLPAGYLPEDIHPGAFDIPGDGIDQDCYGGDRDRQVSELTCVPIAEMPLETQVAAAPPLIMFLLDDSGSMDFDSIISGSEGRFTPPGSMARSYMFYDRIYSQPLNQIVSIDNVYKGSRNGDRYMTETERRYWQSQWAQVNKLYFDPHIDYTPWARWDKVILGSATADIENPANADPDQPRQNPYKAPTLHMDTTYFSVGATVPSDRYVRLTSNQSRSGGYDNWTMADAVLLRPTSGGAPIFLDDSIGDLRGGTAGWFEKTTTRWGVREDEDAYGESARSVNRSGESAVWHLNVPSSGSYWVYAWVPSRGELATNVTYRVKYGPNGGDYRDVVRNQSQNAAQDYERDDYESGDYSEWMRIDGPNANDSFTFTANPVQRIDVPIAHYFTLNDMDDNGIQDLGEDVYLVTVTGGSLAYYRVEDANGNQRVDDGELVATAVGSVPVRVKTDRNGNELKYSQVRQNFANWFSFYRRRELTAKAAVSQVIHQIEEVKLGMAVLNQRSNSSYRKGVLPVKLDGSPPEDKTEELLLDLFKLDSNGGTPLRRGLQDIGQYFDTRKTSGTGSSGEYLPSTPPWASEPDGGACQRAFVIAMTDGYYNGSNSSVQGDLYRLNADSDGLDRDGNISKFDGGVFAGDNSTVRVSRNPDVYETRATLADIAMYYYENDLNESVQNWVPKHNYDTATHQHLVTYGVAFGVTGQYSPEDYSNCLPKCDPDDTANCADPICPPSLPTDTVQSSLPWPAPTSQARKIDDLYHASVNGRGQFFTADNPEKLVGALTAVAQSIKNSTATGSSVSVNTQQLRSDTSLYQATYLPRNWTGDVVAKPIDPVTGLIVQDTLPDDSQTDRVDWSAADQLDGMSWLSRKIITYDNVNGVGVSFAHNNLSSDQQQLLSTVDSERVSLINFLRGDKSQEGALFRTRDSLMGDVVHASPIPYRWDQDSDGVVFVGANDGMLHVLREDTGDELFSYIPNLVFANLKSLADDPYVHKYYVDNEPFISTLGSTGPTLLIGGLGRGGRGYYCLDISAFSDAGFDINTFNAEDNAAALVKWEYPQTKSNPENVPTDPIDDDMGFSFSQAYIVKSNAGWVAIWGNGYDSKSGKAVLYVQPLNSDGTRQAPYNGTNPPLKIDTLAGSATDCNGLSTPALVDVDLDGFVDYAYAGDLHGNLWKFDLSSGNYSQWDVAYFDGALPKPLFQARNMITAPADTGDAGFRQPITTRPDVMRHCLSGRDGYIVIFGTGRFLSLSDYADGAAIQSIYGIWDWADEWSNLPNPPYSDTTITNPIDKYMGYYTKSRGLKNLINNPSMPGTDQTLYSFDLTASNYGDQVSIDGEVFTHGNPTDPANNIFLGAAGLAKCINDPVHGLSDVSAETSFDTVVVRTVPPGGSITYGATGGISVEEQEVNATLLNQVATYHNSQYIIISNNPIDWFSADYRQESGIHVGWSFDLPANGERLVNDVMIRDGIAYIVPIIPSESPCKAGGDSIIYAVSACNGGGGLTVFDIDGDQRVNDSDLINIGTADNPVWVAPDGLKKSGIWYTPAVLSIPGSGMDVLYFSTSGGTVESEFTTGEKLGFYYWRTW
ncbi:MAG: PilC/PilY family type IV pilus protein [Desulfobacterales bacterium]|nr:PilC/PilY family type IV pilus protein [Desulfobacterales bacterium]